MTERTEYFPGDTVRIGDKEFVLPEKTDNGNFRIDCKSETERRATFNQFGELSGHNGFGSLFTLVKRAPKKVTWTVERWAAVLSNDALSYCFSSEENARENFPNAKAYVKLTGTYEEEIDE